VFSDKHPHNNFYGECKIGDFLNIKQNKHHHRLYTYKQCSTNTYGAVLDSKWSR